MNISVLFVCMGNICRSPTAHSIFENLVLNENCNNWISVDSAGTHGYHVGGPPDTRSARTAKMNGIDISGQKSRQVVDSDFENFDYILAMDNSNFQNLSTLRTINSKAKLHMMMEFSTLFSEMEVPDPYYGDDGFDLVYSMLTDACSGLLNQIKINKEES